MNLNLFVYLPRQTVYIGAVTIFIASLAIAPTITNAAGSPNPHWKKGSCDTCHQAVQPTTGDHALKNTDPQALCSECHKKRGAAVCRHRSDLIAEADRTAGFDDALQTNMDNGKLVCTTCHDMTPHCALDIKQRYRNTSFLRGGPYEKRGDQCFGCHSKSGYRQKSPHMHVSKGQIKEGHCVFCHGSVPQQDESGQWQSVQFATGGPLSKLCDGCHMVGPHPSGSVSGKSGWIHMVRPSMDYAKSMNQAVGTRGGSMPLDPNTGEITCTTCHNPHNRRLEGYPNAGEKTKTKLRYENMCEVCHDKK